MIFVELFYHCDHYGCEAHAYVPGDEVHHATVDTAANVINAHLPIEPPEGWQRVNDNKVYCPRHAPVETI